MKARYIIGAGIWSVLIALTLSMIWSFSGEGPAESEVTSSSVSSWLYLTFGFDGLCEFKTFYHVIRKLAHIVEFAVLSVESTALAITLAAGLNRPWRRLYSLYPICFGILVAFIDEGIQMFTARVPSLWDVLIDTVGTLLGYIFVLLVVYIVKRAHNKVANKQS